MQVVEKLRRVQVVSTAQVDVDVDEFAQKSEMFTFKDRQKLLKEENVMLRDKISRLKKNIQNRRKILIDEGDDICSTSSSSMNSALTFGAD